MLNYNYRNGRLFGVGAVVKTPKMQSLLDGVGLPSEAGDVFARGVSALRRGSIAGYFAPQVDGVLVEDAPVEEVPPVEDAPVEEVPPVEDAPVEEVAPVEDAAAGAGWRVKPKPADGSYEGPSGSPGSGSSEVHQERRRHSIIFGGRADVGNLRGTSPISPLLGRVTGDHNDLEAFQLRQGPSHDSCP
jgi:hypothetical protein